VIINTVFVKSLLIYWIAIKTLAANNIGNDPHNPNMPANIPTSIHKAINGDEAPPVSVIRIAIVAVRSK